MPICTLLSCFALLIVCLLAPLDFLFCPLCLAVKDALVQAKSMFMHQKDRFSYVLGFLFYLTDQIKEQHDMSKGKNSLREQMHKTICLSKGRIGQSIKKYDLDECLLQSSILNLLTPLSNKFYFQFLSSNN